MRMTVDAMVWVKNQTIGETEMLGIVVSLTVDLNQLFHIQR